MFNFWALACALLLWIINGGIYSLVHFMVLQGNWNPLPWNIFHLVMYAIMAFLVGYGISGILFGCGLGIVIALYISIRRFMAEGLESI